VSTSQTVTFFSCGEDDFWKGLQVRPGGRQRGGEEARELEDPVDCKRAAVVYGGRGRRHSRKEPGAVVREGGGAAGCLGEPLRRIGVRWVGRAGPHREAIGLAQCTGLIPSEGLWTERDYTWRTRQGEGIRVAGTWDLKRGRRRRHGRHATSPPRPAAGTEALGTAPSRCGRCQWHWLWHRTMAGWPTTSWT
jgi:hypothetical protein